jgi:2-C-methyl-D-erythritol 4-phosphate cytidylyltransferase
MQAQVPQVITIQKIKLQLQSVLNGSVQILDLACYSMLVNIKF